MTTMTKPITNGTAVTLPEKAKEREAWRLLKADFSDAKNIPADRWRLLTVAFASVPDDVLTQAVIAHMCDHPGFFPRVGDLWRQVRKIRPPGPLRLHIEAIARLGYGLESDNGRVMRFVNGSGSVVLWNH